MTIKLLIPLLLAALVSVLSSGSVSAAMVSVIPSYASTLSASQPVLAARGDTQVEARWERSTNTRTGIDGLLTTTDTSGPIDSVARQYVYGGYWNAKNGYRQDNLANHENSVVGGRGPHTEGIHSPYRPGGNPRVVPLPAAAWLFLSGVLALFGAAWRKRNIVVDARH